MPIYNSPPSFPDDLQIEMKDLLDRALTALEYFDIDECLQGEIRQFEDRYIEWQATFVKSVNKS